MLKENCIEGLKVRILDKTWGEPLRNIGESRVGIIESLAYRYVNVVPDFKNISFCFNFDDIEPLSIYKRK